MTEACLSLRCIDIRLFDMVTGFVNYPESTIKMRSLHGNFNVEDVLSLSVLPQYPALHKRSWKVTQIARPQHSVMNWLGHCSASPDNESTDMWTDDYKYISYTTLTLHFINENWKLYRNVLFTCEFPGNRNTDSNIWMEFSRRLVKLRLKPDILSMFISYMIRCLTLCVRPSAVHENKPQFPYIQLRSVEYLQKWIPGNKLTAYRLINTRS
jgi:hypothetical protein